MANIQDFKNKAKSDFQQLREECLARVTRWVYATGPLFSFLPMWNETLQLKPGKEVVSANKAKIKYGFDGGGQLIYFIEDVYKDGTSLKEEFLARVGDAFYVIGVSKSRSYSGDHLFENFQWAHQIVFDLHGRVVRTIGEHGANEYTWKGERMVRIKSRIGKNNKYEDFHYDELGQLKEIWHIYKGHRLLRYRRPPKDISLKTLEPVVHEKLVSAIKKTVERAGIKQQVYCLALAYDGAGNDVLPPCIGIGLDSERQEWIKGNTKPDKDMLWNPAEFTHYEKSNTQLQDKGLEEVCGIYNDLLRPKESVAPAIKLLNAVASELGKLDWSGKLNGTPDFVVYAVDFELRDLKRNLKYSVPRSILTRLQKAKLF